jgi:hypothetical protein
MTRRIEEILDLPSLESLLGEEAVSPETDAMIESIATALEQNQAEIEKDLIDPDGSREHAREMDEIYAAAMTAHKDLLDMGFNMEPKNAGTIIEPSARYLELALKASQNKTDARMKSIKLKLEKEKQEHALKKFQEEGIIESESPVEDDSNGTLKDRNALLKSLKNKAG